MTPTDTMQHKLQRFEDKEAIQTLLSEYCRAC
jgi:hypothetical protein